MNDSISPELKRFYKEVLGKSEREIECILSKGEEGGLPLHFPSSVRNLKKEEEEKERALGEVYFFLKKNPKEMTSEELEEALKALRFGQEKEILLMEVAFSRVLSKLFKK